MHHGWCIQYSSELYMKQFWKEMESMRREDLFLYVLFCIAGGLVGSSIALLVVAMVLSAL
jgi:hypothetical protein